MKTIKEKITPSQLSFPAFVLCPPFYVSTDIVNNKWMEEIKEKIDKDKFIFQWLDFYQVLTGQALVLLIPPVNGLQDQTYVNSGVYLPHIKDKNIVILSNFKAEGRAGEEIALGKFLTDFGYTCIPCPYKFEGEPELKFLKDNIYFGGYGQRTEEKALDWITENYDAKIIKIEEKDPYLYHLDCSVFVINENNIIANTKYWSKKTKREVEKVCTIHEVSEDDVWQGICNSVRCEEFIFNASSLKFMKKDNPDYEKEETKNKTLENIANKLGMEVVYFDMSECFKSGALLSCFVMHLNYKNRSF